MKSKMEISNVVDNIRNYTFCLEPSNFLMSTDEEKLDIIVNILKDIKPNYREVYEMNENKKTFQI